MCYIINRDCISFNYSFFNKPRFVIYDKEGANVMPINASDF